MQNADFSNFTQTTYFLTQDLFQAVFLTRLWYHITQKRMPTNQRLICLIFLRFKSE